MAKPTVVVEGADRLASALSTLGRKVEDMPEAGTKTIAVVLPRARAKAPRRSGRLASSVTGKASGGREVTFGSPLVYFPPIHQGWPRHGIEANPFLRDAVQEADTAIAAAYTDAAQNLCDKAARSV